jgi:hypothetical protein
MNTMRMLVTAIVLIVWTAGLAEAAAYFTGFEEGNKTAYAIGTVLESNIVWTFDSAVHGTIATSDRFEGNRGVRLARNNPGATEASIYTQVITGNFSALSFKYAKYGTDPDVTMRAEVSTDDGATWLQVGTDFVASSTTLTLFQEALGPYQDVNIRIRTISGGTGSRVRSNIDTLTLVPEPVSLSAMGLLVCGAAWLWRRVR